MLNIGPQELLLILVIALVVVGPTRLPELGRSIGKGLREIRKAQDEVKRTIQVNLDEPASPKPRAEQAAPSQAGVDPGLATGETPSDATAPADVAAPAAIGTAGALDAPAATGPDPVPLASEPPSPSEISEISRTLGRSLAELRKAREEVQRGFRVDLGAPVARPTRPSAPAAEPPATSAGPDSGQPDEGSAG